MALKDEHCKPTRKGDTQALASSEAETLLPQLDGWMISSDGQWLARRFTTNNFTASLTLAQKIGDVANKENHHPDLELGWGYLNCKLQTHDAAGLTRNDFILAAKIDSLA